MATKTFSPPTKSFDREVQLETPGGFIVNIREADLVGTYRALVDEDLARAYCEMTGLRTTVKTVYQTTVSPIDPKYEEVQTNDR